MSAFCGCCTTCQPRYKKLVNNIFPADPSEGLVKGNMDKLTFFAMKSPDKLDRIGEYLEQRLSRDIYRQRYGYVNIAMEALDTLLVTCHAQALNLFVESFLKMVQKLLESNEPSLQCLATTSFVKFANIEEDTPSYHRRYDFFVSKFSSMCHNTDSRLETRTSLRISGLHGLQGVVRKTVTDDLQCNIWKPTHMDKIVPSLLFNMQDAGESHAEPESPREDDNPANVAEAVFRDLVCRASYGNINAVIRPVLIHLDNHSLWVPNIFAIRCFKVIMYSVQAQYGYIVVQMLMNHLDENAKKDAQIKASIVEILSVTVLIAAGGSIGPSVLDVFNTLLRHLRLSVDSVPVEGVQANDERNFQESIINTIGEFANNLPDYQKIEIMMFVMGKVPLPSENSAKSVGTEVLLQTMLVKSLLKVATKYKTVLMTNAFPVAFLEPLLRVSQARDAGTRRIVQEILHTLLDRHDNLPKLKSLRLESKYQSFFCSAVLKAHASTTAAYLTSQEVSQLSGLQQAINGIMSKALHELPCDVAELDLMVEKPQRQDVVFIKKNGQLFFWHLYESLQLPNNKVDNFETIYTTMVLLFIELGADEVLLDMFRLALNVQDAAVKASLPITHKCAIQALIAVYLFIITELMAIPALCKHIKSVIEVRQKEAPYYLPEVAFNRSNTSSRAKDDPRYPTNDTMKESWLFNSDIIGEILASAGQDVTRLTTPFGGQPSALDVLVDPNTVDLTHSISDIQSLNMDTESTASTPTMNRRSQAEEVTFESMKRALENDPKAKELEKKQQQRIYESFRTGPFEDIVARSEAKSLQFQNRLDEIFSLISGPPLSSGNGDTNQPASASDDDDEGLSISTRRTSPQPGIETSTQCSVPVYDMQFPQLFVH